MLYDPIITDESIMKEFVIYVDKPPNELPESISELELYISNGKERTRS